MKRILLITLLLCIISINFGYMGLNNVFAESEKIRSVEERLDLNNFSNPDKFLSELKSEDILIPKEQKLFIGEGTDSIFDNVLVRNGDKLKPSVSESERITAFLDEFTSEMKKISAYFYPNLFMYLTNEEQLNVIQWSKDDLINNMKEMKSKDRQVLYKYVTVAQEFYDYHSNHEKYLIEHTPMFTLKDEQQYKSDIRKQQTESDYEYQSTYQKLGISSSISSAESYIVTEFNNTYNYTVNTEELVDPIYRTANREVTDLIALGKEHLDIIINRNYNSLNSKLLKPELELGRSTSSKYYELNGGNAASPFGNEDRKAHIASGWTLNLPVMEKATIKAEVVNLRKSSTCYPNTPQPCFENEYTYESLATPYEKTVFTLEDGSNYEFHDLNIINYPYENIKLEKINNGVNEYYYMLTVNDVIMYKFNDRGEIVNKSNKYGDQISYRFNADTATSNFNVEIIDSYQRVITIFRDSDLVISGLRLEDNGQVIKHIKYNTTQQQRNVSFRKWTTSGYQNSTENITFWRLDSVEDSTDGNNVKELESYTYYDIDSTKLADFNFNVYTPLSGYYSNETGEMLNIEYSNLRNCYYWSDQICFEARGVVGNNKLTSGEIPYLLLDEINYFNGLTIKFSYSNYNSGWRNSTLATDQGSISRLYQDKYALEYISYHPVERVDYIYNENSSPVLLSDYFYNIHYDHGVQMDEFWKSSKQDIPRLRDSSRFGDRQAVMKKRIAPDGYTETSSNHYFVNKSHLLNDYSMVSSERGPFPRDGYLYSYNDVDENNNRFMYYVSDYIKYEYDFGKIRPKKKSTFVSDSSFQIIDFIMNPENVEEYSSDKVTESYTYNNWGEIQSKTDALGNTTMIQYNGPFNQISNIIYTENGEQSETSRTYEYYSSTDNDVSKQNQLWKITEMSKYREPGNNTAIKTDSVITENLSYDALHHKPTKTIRSSSGNQFSTENNEMIKEITYTGMGQIESESTKVTLIKGEPAQNIVMEYEYYPNGNLKKSTYPDGSIVVMDYDFMDRVTTQQWISNQGANSNISISYNDILRKISFQMPDGEILDEFYNPFGIVNKKQRTMNNITRVTLVNDTFAGKIRSIRPYDNQNLKTDIIYDTNGRIVEEINSLGETTSYRYSNVVEKPGDLLIPQQTVKKTLPDGKIEISYYDSFGRLIRFKEETPNLLKKRITSYTYSATGLLLSQKVEDSGISQTTTYSYDGNGNMIYMRNALGDEYKYVYNSLGQVIEMYLNNEIQKNIKHNELGWVIRNYYADNSIESYQYKINGLLDKYVDKKGQTHNYTYTPFNELERLSIKDGMSEIYWQENEYNSVTRNIIKSNNSENEIIFYHWDLWKRNDEKEILGKLYKIGYDNYDRTNSITYPDGKKITYEYDNLNRIEQVKYNDDEMIANYTRTVQNNEITSSIGYPGYLYQTSTRDSFRELKSHYVANGTAFNQIFSYDGFGNIKENIENGRHSTYSYDALNRIQEENQNFETKTYTYNDQGDRSTIQYYDNLENLILGSKQYTYNALNQLKTYSDGDNTASYTYYSDGDRATKTINGDTTRYVYIDGHVIEELDADGNTKARNIWGNELLYRTDYVNNRSGYYFYNGHGDVISIIDNYGDTLNLYEYDIWGNIMSSYDNPTKLFNNPFKYTGEIYDDESGLIYLRARYYDPSLGRFITEDTYKGQIDNSLSLNLYTYVHNNPLIYADPTGNFPWILPILPAIVEVIVGGLTAAGTGIVVGKALDDAGVNVFNKPTIIQQPKVNQGPTVIQQPVIQQKPTVIQQPVIQQKPKVVEQPIVQQKPTVIQQPVINQAPTVLTSNNENGYTAPNGGGGTSNTIKVGGVIVTFGHGGRRDLGMPKDKVENIIARDVANKVSQIPLGETKTFTISPDGTSLIEYRAHNRGGGIINVGTYIPR